MQIRFLHPVYIDYHMVIQSVINVVDLIKMHCGRKKICNYVHQSVGHRNTSAYDVIPLRKYLITMD